MTNFAGAELDPAYGTACLALALRALVLCNGSHEFLTAHGFSDQRLAQWLGFSERQVEKYDMPEARRRLHRLRSAAECRWQGLPEETIIAANVRRLQQRLGLSRLQAEILHFVTLSRLDRMLAAALEQVGALTEPALVSLISCCLGRSDGDVAAALDGGGKLVRSGLLEIDNNRDYSFASKFDLLETLAGGLRHESEDLLALFADSMSRGRTPTLTLADYPHLEKDCQILHQYLTACGAAFRLGVNVLVYGPPGTGKTEFVRTLTNTAGLELFEIPSEDRRGRPRTGKSRFNGYRLAQGLLGGGSRCALLFDEVEDVFCEPEPGGDGNASGYKGWINGLLESNPVPCFWVTNHVRSIDRAYRRRFDYVLRIDVPPRSIRRRMFDRHELAQGLASEWRDQAASHRALAPALIDRAVRVSSAVCMAAPELQPAQVLTRVLNNTLQALGDEPLLLRDPTEPTYRLELLNADCDLARLSEGLRQHGSGRLCLYGPPGTGKSAFGRHVADVLERPLLVRRLSDILRPHVGEAEQNIAAMFEEAAQEGAVLLLDEADSLLRDRRQARQAWEVNHVNEMLTQMERFLGIFVASTNLADSLDEASLRRFDARISFGFLSPAQSQVLFAELCASLQLVVQPEAQKLVMHQQFLTPGDFACLRRGARLQPPADSVAAARTLARACENKPAGRARSIGFTAS